MNDEAVKWLREQINWTLDYAQTNAARRPINPMRSHEMRDLIAGREAELAILDACQSAIEAAEFPDFDGGYASGLEDAVKILAGGYKHRKGYAEQWGDGQ